jgi:hypothetical protein
LEITNDTDVPTTVGIQEEREHRYDPSAKGLICFARVGEHFVIQDEWLKDVIGGFNRTQPYVDLGTEYWVNSRWQVVLGYRWNFCAYPAQKRMNTIGRICISYSP